MNHTYKGGRVVISGLENFSLCQCLDCGQAFRWKQHGKGYRGAALGLAVYAEQNGDTLAIDGVDKNSVEAFIRYFDLRRDYASLQKQYSKDPFLKEGICYASGLRVLAQPPFETLITFIISANNNIARIKRIIDSLCARFGAPLAEGMFDFPSPKALAEASERSLLDCGTGYRAAYIKGAAQMVADGFDFDGIGKLPYEAARQALTALPGVGLKVADCVALYGFSFLQAFPFDVWMRRVLRSVYGYGGKTDTQMRDFVDNKFGKHAGIAQQYLFHYARHHKDLLDNNQPRS